MNHNQQVAITKFLIPVLTIAVVGAGIILNVSITQSDTRTLTRANSQIESRTNWGFADGLDDWRVENMQLLPQSGSQFVALSLRPNQPGGLVSHKLKQSLDKGAPHVTISFALKAMQNGSFIPASQLAQITAHTKVSYLTQKDPRWNEAKTVVVPVRFSDSLQQVRVDLSQSPYLSHRISDDTLTFLKIEPVLANGQASSYSIEYDLDNINLSF